MTSDEILPALIIVGYIAAFGLGRLGSKLRRQSRPPEPVDTGVTDTEPVVLNGEPQEPVEQPWEGRERYRAGTWLLTAGWLLGIAVSVFWGVVSVGWGKLLVIIGMLIVAPAVVSFVVALIAAVRRERGEGPSPVPWMLAVGAGVVLLVVSANLTVNGLSTFAGYAPETQLHVTDRYGGGKKSGSRVSGTYVFDGEEHSIDNADWGGDGVAPEKGAVVDMWVGPLWPHPALTGNWDSGRLLLFAGFSAFAGGACLFGAFRERKRVNAENRNLSERRQWRTQ
ncbi:hypothetical protein [Saccharomonospora cyanea]|uniref:DUF3592 domain-containing protein n=1 Tax=Saccharomonospora cyanea NA-134 TaxID=882082 RepID=H5XG94_9PSEU|nr:hypothetical protein [Saccharomonospora cyanea]EHR59413.1 hypothetical protein SaccyDRAFT_0485 [Saccharomonospora cyanea NA-134]